MQLRKLELRDAPLMLEWMHDKNVVENLNTDFSVKTLEDCINFIKSSQNDKQNLHLAITDDSNTYMGTVSLKHIENQTAEFGIAIRTLAIGKGYSRFAMKEIFDKGFNELKLLSIYWCVAPQNKRAIRFYEKNGYKRTSPDNLRLGGGGTAKLKFKISTGTKLQKKNEKTLFKCCSNSTESFSSLSNLSRNY